MMPVSERLQGMDLNEAKALLRKEGVTFTVRYTEAINKKHYYENREEKTRIVRIIENPDEELELTVCVV